MGARSEPAFQNLIEGNPLMIISSGGSLDVASIFAIITLQRGAGKVGERERTHACVSGRATSMVEEGWEVSRGSSGERKGGGEGGTERE